MTTGVAAEFVCGHPTIPEQVIANFNSKHIYFRVAAVAAAAIAAVACDCFARIWYCFGSFWYCPVAPLGVC